MTPIEWEMFTEIMKSMLKELKEISGDIKKNGLDIKEIKENINKEIKESAEFDESDIYRGPLDKPFKEFAIDSSKYVIKLPLEKGKNQYIMIDWANETIWVNQSISNATKFLNKEYAERMKDWIYRKLDDSSIHLEIEENDYWA